jgi:putative ABC transport system permease protein
MSILSPILWVIAFRSLMQHRIRTPLLVALVAMVTVLFVLVTGLYVGAQATLLTSATTLMSGHVNVAGFFKANASQSAPVVTGYRHLLEEVKRQVPELDYVVHRGRGWAKLVGEGGSMQVGVGGLSIDGEAGFRRVIVLKSGSLEGLRQDDGMLVFEKQATKLGLKVGDKCTLAAPTPRGTNNTLDVTIVAIAADVGLLSSWNTFMNDRGLRRLYQLNDETTGALQLYLRDIEQAPAVQERLRKGLAKAGYAVMEADPRPFFMKFDNVNRESWTGQQLDITNWEDEVSFIKWLSVALAFFGSGVIFILVVVIAVGIMNVMWISIDERTREIGTLRAVGMQRGAVVWMFALESLVLGLLGTISGAGLGALIATLATRSGAALPQNFQLLLLTDHLVVLPTPFWMLFAVVAITAVITVVSLVPSFRAARQKPITAMSHVG